MDHKGTQVRHENFEDFTVAGFPGLTTWAMHDICDMERLGAVGTGPSPKPPFNAFQYVLRLCLANLDDLGVPHILGYFHIPSYSLVCLETLIELRLSTFHFGG